MTETELYRHQKEVLDMTKGYRHVGYYLDMGLGKTYVGSEKMNQLGNVINLIICQKSKVADWKNHCLLNYPTNNVFDLTDKKEYEQFFTCNNKKVGIINYELAWRRKDLLNLENFTLMLDESSLIQNKGTKQAKFVLKLRPANVILLSGTPVGGKYENLWTQLHLLGWDISESLYQKQYVNWTLTEDDGSGVRHKIVDKDNPYKNVERLKTKMREHGSVFMKTEEVIDLPEQTFVKVSCDRTKEYNKFMHDSIVTVNDIELVGDTTLTKMLYARQLCSQYSAPKLEAFKDLLESTNDRLIVFYNFNAELEKLRMIALENERPVSFINGHGKNLENYERYDDSVTLVQYQAGAKGLNLQKANKVVYFSLTLSSEDFEQSKKRIHRIGQEKPCFYYVMVTSSSIEEHIYQTLQERKNYTDELFKGVYS